MKKVAKIVAWSLAGLLLLLVVVAAVVAALFDPNDYRDQITALAQQHTGRELRIGGDLSLSFFPWLGVEVAQVELGNAPGFGPEPMARVEQAEARVKLLPLLRKQVEVDTVVLDGLHLNLARNARGETNWQDLIPEAPPPEAPPPEPSEQPTLPETLAALALEGIIVTDARVQWQDGVTGQQVLIDDLRFETGALRFDAPIPLRTAFAFRLAEPNLDGNVRLVTELGLDLEREIYRLWGVDLTATAKGEMLPAGAVEARLTGEALANLVDDIAELTGLQLSAYGARLQTTVRAERLIAGPEAQGTFTLNVQDPQTLAAAVPGGALPPAALKGGALEGQFSASLADQTLSVPNLTAQLAGTVASLSLAGERIIDAPALSGDLTLTVRDGRLALAPVAEALPEGFRAEALSGANLALGYGVDLGKETATVEGLKLSAVGVSLTGGARGRAILSEPVFSGRLQSDEFVPRDVSSTLGLALPETADPSALTKARLVVAYEAGLDQAALTLQPLRLDETRLTGTASIRNFAQPAIRYDLSVDAIDLDRYLPPEAAAAPEGAAAPARDASGTEPPIALPVEMLRGLDLQGRLRVKSLKAANLQASAIDATALGQKGVFRLHPLSARLYGGTYSGDLGLNVAGAVPRFSMNERLTGIQAGPLLQALMGKDYVTGAAGLTARMTAAGLEPMAIRKSLTGDATFKFENGAVKGFNIAQLLREASARLKGQPAPKEGTPRQTDFAVLSGSLKVANGIARNSDLVAQSPLLRVSGQGQVNLVEETVDYRVNASIVGTLEGQGGKELSELRDLTIPLRIRGPLTQPKFSVELESALKARAEQALEKKKQESQQQLEQRLEREKEKAQKQLEEKLKNMLKF